MHLRLEEAEAKVGKQATVNGELKRMLNPNVDINLVEELEGAKGKLIEMEERFASELTRSVEQSTAKYELELKAKAEELTRVTEMHKTVKEEKNSFVQQFQTLKTQLERAEAEKKRL